MAFAIEKQTIFTTILSKLLFKKRSPAAAVTCCPANLTNPSWICICHYPSTPQKCAPYGMVCLSINPTKLYDGIPQKYVVNHKKTTAEYICFISDCHWTVSSIPEKRNGFISFVDNQQNRVDYLSQLFLPEKWKKGRNQEEFLSISALKRLLRWFESTKPLKWITENALQKFARKTAKTLAVQGFSGVDLLRP